MHFGIRPASNQPWLGVVDLWGHHSCLALLFNGISSWRFLTYILTVTNIWLSVITCNSIAKYVPIWILIYLRCQHFTPKHLMTS